MGNFLRSFKYHLVLGKLLGVVFFSDKNETANFSDFLWIIPLLSVYFYTIFRRLIYFPLTLIQNELLQIGDHLYVIVSNLSFVFRILYYLVKQNSLRKLLSKLDDFDMCPKPKTFYKMKSIKLLLHLFCFALITTYNSFSWQNTPWVVIFLYVIGSYSYFLHEIFACEIYQNLYDQFQFINGKVLKISNHNQEQRNLNPKEYVRSLKKWIKLHQEFTKLSSETITLFGLPILANTIFSLSSLVITIFFWKFLILDGNYLGLLSMVWNATMLVIFAWPVQKWTGIQTEVSFI